MKYLYVDDDCVVAVKEGGMPSAPIKEGETDNALFHVSLDYPEVLKVQGKKSIEGGILHRLDTATTGLLLFARNQFFYDELIKAQENNLFIKEYTAVCSDIKNTPELLEGFPIQSKNVFSKKINFPVEITSRFRSYGKGQQQVRPVTEDSVGYATRKNVTKTQYKTEILSVENYKKDFMVKCRISKGFRHQVRCHLAWCGLPVVGDFLYNPLFNHAEDNQTEKLFFFATKIEFPHPVLKRKICVQMSLDFCN